METAIQRSLKIYKTNSKYLGNLLRHHPTWSQFLKLIYSLWTFFTAHNFTIKDSIVDASYGVLRKVLYRTPVKGCFCVEILPHAFSNFTGWIKCCINAIFFFVTLDHFTPSGRVVDKFPFV